MKRSKAEMLGQSIQAKFFAAAMTGPGSPIEGLGPCLAVSKALSQCMLSKDVVDIYEIDEQRPSYVLHCIDELHLDPARVNPRAAPIPCDECTAVVGLKQPMSGLCHARATGVKILITAVAANVGRGMAGIWVNEIGT